MATASPLVLVLSLSFSLAPSFVHTFDRPGPQMLTRSFHPRRGVRGGGRWEGPTLGPVSPPSTHTRVHLRTGPHTPMQAHTRAHTHTHAQLCFLPLLSIAPLVRLSRAARFATKNPNPFVAPTKWLWPSLDCSDRRGGQ
eukprot:NODE_1536_length_947_cov_15.596882_g1072_i0.p3 GENE.NODE_1536_length_947_cov_15.596882_g1072_i0~~NODE_1536_length_947_cov_15.596882_g1072_i0.p3  ORF type:complete len:139 (+),score=7.16 NODE_1536_length_947_cov_15.596882_g1072_i0:487-903(+)